MCVLPCPIPRQGQQGQDGGFVGQTSNVLFVDDAALVAHTSVDLQVLRDCFATACTAFGLKISDCADLAGFGELTHN